MRPEHHVDVDVGVRPARHGRDHADLAGEQGVVDVRGQEVGVAHERRDEPGGRRLEDRCGVSACSITPSRMTTTRSPIDSASVWSWVTSSAVVPVSRSARHRVGPHLGPQGLVEAAERLVEQHHGRAAGRAPGRARPAAARRRTARGGSGSARCPSRTSSSTSPTPAALLLRGSAGRARRRRCARPSGAGTARGPGRPGRPGAARAAARCAGPATTSPAIADRAGVGSLQAGDQAQRGGLAAAGGADQRDELAGRRRRGRGRERPPRRRTPSRPPSSRGRGPQSPRVRLPVGGADLPEQEEHRDDRGRRRSRSAGSAAFSQKFSLASW